MAMSSERKIAAAGMASGVLGICALMLSVSSLMLGLGARDDGITYLAASTGDHR